MATPSSTEFKERLAETIKALRAAKRNRIKLSSSSFYGRKVRSSLASLRKSFIAMERDFPAERYGKIAFQLATIEPLLQQIIMLYPASSSELLALAEEISFKAESDLAAELETTATTLALSSSAPFVPNDLIEDRHFILKKVLWEVNRCYDTACYNSCAAMIRRLTESLIVQSFEKHGIEGNIKKGGEYLPLSDLIGKAIAEPKLGLTKNTKRILPDLKFFGDLASHNRKALVHKDDLDKLHQATRSAIEELVYNI